MPYSLRSAAYIFRGFSRRFSGRSSILHNSHESQVFVCRTLASPCVLPHRKLTDRVLFRRTGFQALIYERPDFVLDWCFGLMVNSTLSLLPCEFIICFGCVGHARKISTQRHRGDSQTEWEMVGPRKLELINIHDRFLFGFAGQLQRCNQILSSFWNEQSRRSRSIFLLVAAIAGFQPKS